MENKAIILFDGVCNFCDRSVQFVLRRDKKAYFNFASLQSEIGQQLLEKYKIPKDKFESLVLIENDKAYLFSTGALRIARKLNGAWPILYGFIIIPSFIRDFFYKLIANNRYKIFGKKEECMIPSPEWRSRFL